MLRYTKSEEKKEKERTVTSSKVEKEKNCLIMGFVHKEPLSLPNSKASILPSFDSSYAQVLVRCWKCSFSSCSLFFNVDAIHLLGTLYMSSVNNQGLMI